PLTWISHQLDCTLFGLNPAAHHLVSLLLHALNTVLLFLWLDGLTGLRWRVAILAAIWGLHPLHVESVAWVSERKDVLSALCWMLALLAYAAYVRKPGFARYAIVAACFTAGLLSKPMVVTLPAILLLIDWRQRHPLRLTEKLPLFALAAAGAWMTVWAHQQSSSIASTVTFPLQLRLANAAISYWRYLTKTIVPIDLAAFYPMPRSIPAGLAIAAMLGLLAVTYFAMRDRRIAFGWLWYLITLAPVIGIVQTGMQSMADRYMYLPMAGLLAVMAWETRHARAVIAASPLAIAACATLTIRQIPVWHDGVTLFTHAIRVTDGNFVAQDNLGVELDRRGRSEEALAHYREAVRIRPGDRNSESNLAHALFDEGERLFRQGRLDDALAQFREGLPHAPQNAMAHTWIGLILMQQEHLPAALAEFRLAVAIDPKLARAHVGLGVALVRSGEIAAAKQELLQALKLDPANVEAKFDLDLIDRATSRH
ncbi:MAG TPA: tetratricopeptide repeat protein, partial [Candidatus Solibacter sp.]|nr:tetratricopeptide repeat protein [Candidatus Solibacter sp.]